MRTVKSTQAAQWCGRMVTVGAVALLLAGTTAAPAGAFPKENWRTTASRNCESAEGEEWYFNYFGVPAVVCYFGPNVDADVDVAGDYGAMAAGVPDGGSHGASHAADKGRHQAHTQHHHRSHGGNHGTR